MHAPSPRLRILAPQQPFLAARPGRRLMSRLNGVDNARTGRGRINRVVRTMSRSETLRGDSRMVGIPEVVGYRTGLVRFVTAHSTTPAIGQQIVEAHMQARRPRGLLGGSRYRTLGVPARAPSLMPAAASAWSLRRATAAPRSAGGGPILARSPSLLRATRGGSAATQRGPLVSVSGCHRPTSRNSL